MKLAIISLGCAKNQIDTELFLGVAHRYGIEITDDFDEADILVVNTCGFILPAKQEAIDTILDLIDYKENKKIIIAMGCFIQRYRYEVMKEFPEVDYFIPIDDYPKIDEVFQKITGINRSYKFDYQNRFLTTLPHSAYLRIGEGCNNRCSYCAIPLIRGNYVSRNLDSLIEEAKGLADSGVKELTVIAQDTTMYGTDLPNGENLSILLKKLANIKEFKWIRVLYLYPDEITDDVIETIKQTPKLVPYFDIPLQHASDNMLRSMNRRGTKNDIIKVINKIRAIPNAVIRSTFMVGFPGETENDYQELKDFIKTYQLDHIGIFCYSDEEGTKGFDMQPKVDQRLANHRYKELMKIQQQISKNNNQKYLNQTIEVLIDYYDFDKGYYVARSFAYAPDDVDGCIYLKPVDNIMVGNFYQVKITKVSSYDLYGEFINNKK